MKKILLALLSELCAARACAVQPATHADLPATVAVGGARQTGASTRRKTRVDAAAWWAQFGDPVLHELVGSVLSQNLDVQAALERVKQAKPSRRSGAPRCCRNSTRAPPPRDARQNTPPPLGYVRQAGIGLTLELDARRVRRRASGTAGRAGAVDGPRACASMQLRLALAANTASAYVDLRWAQSEQKILQDNVCDPRTRIATDAGAHEVRLSTQLDVARAQNQLSELQARFPRAAVDDPASVEPDRGVFGPHAGIRRYARARHARADSRRRQDAVPQMLPSEALLRRPDVRSRLRGGRSSARRKWA